MKRSISLLSVLAFVLAFSGSVFGQDVVNTSATVVQDINYTKETDLDFGIFQTSFSSTATIDPQGNSDSNVNGTRGNDYNAGKVFISGANNQTVTVSLSQTSIQLNAENITTNDNFTLTPITMSHTTGQNGSNGGGNTLSDGGEVGLDGSGDATVWIGGDLKANDDGGDGMDPDTYSNNSDLTLTIDYAVM